MTYYFLNFCNFCNGTTYAYVNSVVIFKNETNRNGKLSNEMVSFLMYSVYQIFETPIMSTALRSTTRNDYTGHKNEREV